MFINTRNLKESNLPTGFKRDAGMIPGRGARGFSLIELTVVLILASVTLGMGIGGLSGYRQRVAAHHAAQLFVLDLSLAREAETDQLMRGASPLRPPQPPLSQTD